MTLASLRPVGTPSWLRPLETWYAAGVVLAVHVVVAWRGRAFGIDTGNDDALYLLLSRSLRLLTYRDLHEAGSGFHSQYPPGFPAFLGVLSLPFGEHFDVLLAGIVASSVIALALLYDVIRRAHGPLVALAVLLLSAVNPAMVEYAGSLASETPYFFFSMLCVWAILRETQSPKVGGHGTWFWPTVAVTGAVMAALTRSIGVTLIGALLLLWAGERRYRRLTALAVSSGVTVGGWLLWTVLAPAKIVGRSYVADAVFVPAERQSFAFTLIDRLTSNVPTYLTAKVPSAIANPTIAGTIVDNLIGVIALIVLGAVGVWQLWKDARVVVIYLAVCAALLAFWPWNSTRFLVPLIPFILWIVVIGASRLSPNRMVFLLPLLVTGILVTTALSRNISVLRSKARCDREAAATSDACYTDEQQAYFALARYIRSSTPDTSIFLTVQGKEATLAYLAKRRVLIQALIQNRDSARLLPELHSKSVDYIVVTPLKNPYEQLVHPLAQNCPRLRLVMELPEITLLMRMAAADDTTAARNACDALHRYERRYGSGES